MEIKIYRQLEGAAKAEGLTVVIDVFRAFTVECFLFEKGIKNIYAVSGIEDCFKIKEQHQDYILVGERNGVKIAGFDVGNSPSQICEMSGLDGKVAVHTTSAGVQGIVSAVNATEILTGSFVNAKATAEYIKSKNPEKVSLVCMGLNGKEDTQEDLLCADYIKSLLLGGKPAVHEQIADLKNTSGSKFFLEENRNIFPEPDFFMCLVPDIFNFVIKAEKKDGLIKMEKI